LKEKLDSKLVLHAGTTALTEQPTFLALLLYRMERWKLAGQFFFWGAIWTLICKIALTVTTVYFWGFNVNLFVSGNPRYESLVMWVYLFWFLIIPLFVSQIYAAVIMFKLWKGERLDFEIDPFIVCFSCSV
jgi:hypothetical protein